MTGGIRVFRPGVPLFSDGTAAGQPRSACQRNISIIYYPPFSNLSHGCLGGLLKTVDFLRSYLTFRIDHNERQSKTVTHRPAFTLNNARILLDSRCEISDRRTGQSQTFVQGASCKTER